MMKLLKLFLILILLLITSACSQQKLSLNKENISDYKLYKNLIVYDKNNISYQLLALSNTEDVHYQNNEITLYYEYQGLKNNLVFIDLKFDGENIRNDILQVDYFNSFVEQDNISSKENLSVVIRTEDKTIYEGEIEDLNDLINDNNWQKVEDLKDNNNSTDLYLVAFKLFLYLLIFVTIILIGYRIYKKNKLFKKTGCEKNGD